MLQIEDQLDKEFQEYQEKAKISYKERLEKVARDQLELVNNEIAADIKALEPLKKIAGKPKRNKEFKPFNSKQLQ